jgi:small subunit ribosomal protein S7
MRNQKKRKFGIQADPRYNDKMVTQFVNNIMLSGKKNTAFNIFYSALDIVEKRMKDEELSSLEIWKKAIENVTPQVEVKSRRVGGATFQVPTEINPARKMSISMKNMIKFARARRGKSMAEKLAAEILDAYKEEGGAFKRKEETHRMAEANKAFAHFRF